MAQGLGDKTHETLERIGKPFFVGEFGSYRPLWKGLPSEAKSRDGEPTIERHGRVDPAGLHLHNGIWTSGLTGAVGALPWFTCDYIDPFDMYHVFTGFSRFVADWKINAGPWHPVAARVAVDAEGPRTYHIYAMGLGDEVRLWLQNRHNTHWNQFHEKLPTTAPAAEVRVPVENNGRYEVQWWDTYEGKPTRHETVNADDGVLTLSFPGTTSDEACKIQRVP